MSAEESSSAFLERSLPPANDRMLTTLFVAALLHGIIILGVTFGIQKKDVNGPDSPALEVVLVGDQAPSVAANPDAQYIAQRSQLGSGNTLKNERALIPTSSAVPMDRLGVPSGEGMESTQSDDDFGDEDIVATHIPSLKILYFASAAAAPDAAELPMLLEKRPDLGMTANDDGVQLRIRGESKKQLWVAADTRESDVAVYLDSWRRKIERVGTMNFPNVVRRQQLSGTPIIEVTIGADGRLLQTVVRRSSGHAEIDEAAVRILKMAAPYDPFSRALNAKHDQIRIAYEWQFLGGAAQGSAVFYSDSNEQTAQH